MTKDDDKAVKVLNWIIMLHEEGVTYEADPRHIEIIVHDLGLGDEDICPIPFLPVLLEFEKWRRKTYASIQPRRMAHDVQIHGACKGNGQGVHE